MYVALVNTSACCQNSNIDKSENVQKKHSDLVIIPPWKLLIIIRQGFLSSMQEVAANYNICTIKGITASMISTISGIVPQRPYMPIYLSYYLISSLVVLLVFAQSHRPDKPALPV